MKTGFKCFFLSIASVLSIASISIMSSTLGIAKEVNSEVPFQDDPVRMKAIQSDLNTFLENPEAFLNRKPQKFDASGNVVTDNPMNLTSEEINDGSWVKKKFKAQQEVWERSGLKSQENNNGLDPFTGINYSSDNPESVVDVLKHRTLWDLEWWWGWGRKQYLSVQPWSDSYWPHFLGSLAQRYSDPSFPFSEDFTQNSSFVQQNMGRASNKAFLSPAEKYDLYVGDTSFSLTQASLGIGQEFYDQYRKVETWMGICHGWSAASFMMDRPVKAFWARSAMGEDIPFYPSDIKALASMLWANGFYHTRGAGVRCNIKNPGPETRYTNPECFDNNPGTFHLAVVNQIGEAKRSIIMDATWDYEVWNQPIFGYEYSYFNPRSMQITNDIQSASVERSEFSNDRFRSSRALNTKWIVGIAMDVSYMIETRPTLAANDDPSRDAIRKVRYYYDLEIDQDNNIIGGEWYTKEHPDFLWVPQLGSRIMSPGDNLISTQGRASASRVSARSRLPLATVVEELISQSR